MSNTPRTEIYVLDRLPEIVPADWARQLERELAAANARISALEAHAARLEEAGDACAETSTTPQRMEWERVKGMKP